MNAINKISSHSAIDYAAEELRKYLRMMMPECGDFEVKYAPAATDGFRLGLMSEFGLDTSDATDTELDDIIYIDTDADGGVIAGDNPRSVLIAVYEYLRRNGCRWLMPGVDGEYIPIRDIVPVKYRHKPSMRYRGMCNEGAEYQAGMYDFIDFLPKVGMNVFMMEFFIPTNYYRRYYNHMHNEKARPPEPITDKNILQWKRACEAELSKRGLQFHDIGHGWGAEAFGIDTGYRGAEESKPLILTSEQIETLALVDGKRKLWNNVPKDTQFCMSRADLRKKVVDFVADYAEKNTNSDYLHVWLGDGVNNQCECAECKLKTPSDWYVIMLNELDAELSSRGLDTRVVFIIYGDSTWSPICEKIKNQKRFTCLFAPIARDFSKPISKSQMLPKPDKYVRNKNELPCTFEGVFAHYLDWKRMWRGASIAYEYHFWRHQYYDLGGIALAKNVHNDVRFYFENGVSGVIEDGSQRSFFPTGLAFYTYARTLFDASLSFDKICEDYMSVAFGESWREFYDYLESLGEAFGFEYLEGRSEDSERSPYFSSRRAESLMRVSGILERGKKLVRENYNFDFRVGTVAVRILEKHASYAELFADALVEKARGNDDEADRLFVKMKEEFGKEELAIEPYYDHTLAVHGIKRIFETRTKDTAPVIY